MAAEPFNPDWTVAPAATLQEWMDNHGASITILADIAHPAVMDREQAAVLLQAVLDRGPYAQVTADLLAHVTGVSARLWLALERQYRADLAAGRTDTTEGATNA